MVLPLVRHHSGRSRRKGVDARGGTLASARPLRSSVGKQSRKAPMERQHARQVQSRLIVSIQETVIVVAELRVEVEARFA